jgi:hypothetical protein
VARIKTVHGDFLRGEVIGVLQQRDHTGQRGRPGVDERQRGVAACRCDLMLWCSVIGDAPRELRSRLQVRTEPDRAALTGQHARR